MVNLTTKKIVDELLGTSRRDGLTRTLICTLAYIPHGSCTLYSKNALKPHNLLVNMLTRYE